MCVHLCVCVASFPNVTVPLASKNDVIAVSTPTPTSTISEEKMATAQTVTNNDVKSLQQEENLSISGSNARLMIMKKLSRKSEARRHWDIFTSVSTYNV